ncbi:sn-glycerol 3-phosphate transport system permease protein [Pseudarthrobacter sp. PvP004]|uniref:carbohydrate ABC transporter permease n=1 Tax=Pseudarthrobacter sp. PvP004 TaxID=2817850 RepID=UPI001AE34105|nr:sugar ABC transporter permease [Pseudarthrobacter sp. PvP004]MBP2264969.1 sn-glycerol 3-phosphate transport system permease protein [Pseudarthrobacter sp. PvP004]
MTTRQIHSSNTVPADRPGIEPPAPPAAPAKPGPDRKRWSARSRREFLVFLAMALPNLVLIGTFTYWPLINNIYYSTLDWTLGSASATVVGLQNYVTFFTGEDASKVLGTTAIFTLVTVGGSMVLGLLVALALNSKVRGTTFARSAVFAPYVLSGVGVGLVWLFIFDPGYGVLAWVLRGLGQQSPQWINDPQLSLVMVIIVYVWKNLGYCAVVYLAGLQSLPRDVMEAAALDGANSARRFFNISLPLLSPTTFFLLITTMLSSLQAFDLIRIMTPLGNGTSTLIYEAYLQAFGAYNRAGYSAAISVILFAILLIITVLQLRFVERKVHYS